MKLSTKGRYGVRAMFELALHYPKAPIPLKDIAMNQDISEKYLEQIFSALRKMGLVKSIRGMQGGYELTSSPQDITVGQILRVLEGDLAPVDCILDESVGKCDRYDSCVTKYIWKRIGESINDIVDSISLQDLVDDYRLKEQDYAH